MPIKWSAKKENNEKLDVPSIGITQIKYLWTIGKHKTSILDNQIDNHCHGCGTTMQWLLAMDMIKVINQYFQLKGHLHWFTYF